MLCAKTDAHHDNVIINATIDADATLRRITGFQSLTEHDVEAALELRVSRMLEGDERIVAFQIDIPFQANAAALQAPFARERPAAEQILLQHDLVIARRFCRGWFGLHENAHPASLTRDAAGFANVATLSSGCRKNAANGVFGNVTPLTPSTGSIVLGSGQEFTINYAANLDVGAIGNDITATLAAVPEPSTFAGLLGGIALFAGMRRRRSK